MKKYMIKTGIILGFLYFFAGLIMQIVFDYQDISEEGFWNWLLWGRNTSAFDYFFRTVFWPFYL
jgi:hypothetical protein